MAADLQAVPAVKKEPSRPYMCVGFRAADEFSGYVIGLDSGPVAILNLFKTENVQFYSSAHLRELAEVAGRLADELDAANVAAGASR